MNEYMKIAKELSEENMKTNAGGPFGACIVKDGEVIGKGSNHVLVSNDPTAHAEIVAIREACKRINSYDLSGCELYTSCYPCPMCMSALVWSNIKKVYYGNTKEDPASIGFKDAKIYNLIRDLVEDKNDKNVIELECIDREETIDVFNRYKEKEDKIIY